jgi:hypothetical protein
VTVAVSPPASLSHGVRDGHMRFMTRLVRVVGLYNASAVVLLLAPGALGLVDAQEPCSNFWTWLAGLFGGIVLLLSGDGPGQVGSLPYWNGIRSSGWPS